jgi:hypothetical protein
MLGPYVFSSLLADYSTPAAVPRALSLASTEDSPVEEMSSPPVRFIASLRAGFGGDGS